MIALDPQGESLKAFGQGELLQTRNLILLGALAQLGLGVIAPYLNEGRIFDPWILRIFCVSVLSGGAWIFARGHVFNYQLNHSSYQLLVFSIGLVQVLHSFWLAWANPSSDFYLMVSICFAVALMSLVTDVLYLSLAYTVSVTSALANLMIQSPRENQNWLEFGLHVALSTIALFTTRSRIQVYQFLKRKLEEHSRILSQMNSAIVVVDKEGTIQSFNSKAKELFSFLPQGFNSRTMLFEGVLLQHEDRLVSWQDLPIYTTQQTGEARSEYELQVLVDNLATRWLVLSTAPLTSENKAPYPVLVNVRDISAEKEVQLLKDQHKAFLSSTSKLTALGEMAAGIAHEINNPLAIISGKATHLSKLLRAPEVNRVLAEDALNKIQKTVQRIAKIIQSMRTISRNNEQDPMERVKLHRLIDDTLVLCQDEFYKYQIEIILNIDTSHEISCRPGQIGQVLMNLLGNSKDAVKDQSNRWIRIESTSLDSGKRIEIRVSDNGPGISPDIRQKIMQPFFTTKDSQSGTGLGLSISFGIAQAHGGILKLDPKLKPTTFILELPTEAIDSTSLSTSSQIQ